VKIQLSDARVQIDLTRAEACVLFEELVHVRGGSRLPKLRQVCAGLAAVFMLMPKGKGKTNDQRI